MQDILSESLNRIKIARLRRSRLIAIVLVLSLLVSLDVFWMLRQPGLTLAGNADCRITEHTHDSQCQGGEDPCSLTEHVHTLACYSDPAADVETQLDWQALFEDYPYTKDLRQDLAGIAKTQVGYQESSKNFQVDAVYASDLQRAACTAIPIAKQCGKELIKAPQLREIFAGQWQGMCFDQLQTEHRVQYRTYTAGWRSPQTRS